MSLRPATEADLDALATLEQDLFGDDAWSRGSVAAEVSAGRVLVADAGLVAGRLDAEHQRLVRHGGHCVNRSITTAADPSR